MSQPALYYQPASRDYVNLHAPAGVYEPDYQITVYQEGDPRRPLPHTLVDLSSVTALQTSKSLNDIAGTFTFTLKDGVRAKQTIREMDVVVIRLKGTTQMGTVLIGVIDSVSQAGSADPQSADESATVSGRCLAKYLQITSTFRPVWNADSVLATSLVFGWGASTDANVRVGTSPRSIFGYLYRHFIVGVRNRVGQSGVPNARFWLTYDHQRDANGRILKRSRFQDVPDFQHILFIQFDEQDMGTALKQFEVLGFTEAWVDELGNIVYRKPQWDAPYSYLLPTTQLKHWQFEESDVDLKTYAEVIPAGVAGLGSSSAQATMTGRAPITSALVTALTGQGDQRWQPTPDFIIETDGSGAPTAKGRQNPWYRRQRKYGLRPLQISSPLITNVAQAQAQAEGLLRFFARFSKTGTVTIPGDPRVRLGATLRLVGELDGLRVDRAYYIEGVQHDYVDGSHYDTTLQLTHGRDPWDSRWRQIVLPDATPVDAALDPGVLSRPSDGVTSGGPVGFTVPGVFAQIQADGRAIPPAGAPPAVRRVIEAANKIIDKPYIYGAGHSGSLDTIAGAYDCSSTVTFALHGGGLFGSTADTSGGLAANFGNPGPGQWITVYANANHCFMHIAGIRLDTSPQGGAAPGVPAGKGPRWRSVLRDGVGFTSRHPVGL